MQSEIIYLSKNLDRIRKGHLEDCKVLIRDTKNSDDDNDEEINEGEEAKIMMEKVGTKERRKHCSNCRGCLTSTCRIEYAN